MPMDLTSDVAELRDAAVTEIADVALLELVGLGSSSMEFCAS